MAVVRIELFGTLRVTCDGRPLPGLNRGRLQTLLAYLVLRAGQPVSREHLAFTLWPDSNEAQARTNLRQLLHHLRRALASGSQFLELDSQTVCWRRDPACEIDVQEFADAAAAADAARDGGHPDAERRALERASAVYHDDLLRGLYDEWLQPKRQALRDQLARMLLRQVELSASADPPKAIELAERLLTLDPLREPHYRLLMELHERNGDRAAALRTYHQCMRVLRRELAVAPAEATRQLFDRILKTDKSPDPRPAHTPTRNSALPMIGRAAEWERLLHCRRRVELGEIVLALAMGEPGIGKSRLAAEWCDWWSAGGAPVARARCYAARGQLAFAPVEEWLKSDALRQARAQLSRAQVQDLARVAPELLAENPDLQAPAPLTDSWQRRHFYEALKAAVANAADPAGARPLLLMVDDLQWCDQDSFAWLHFLFTSGARGILVLGTARPEESEANQGLSALMEDLMQLGMLESFPVGPLAPNEVDTLAARIANRELDPVYLRRLYAATGGNPLFVVESVRAKLDDPGKTPDAGDVPLEAVPLVQAVIAGRLTQLSAPAQELAGMAAAAGRAFSFDLLAKATDWDEESVMRALDELWRRRIVEAQAGGFAAVYDFSHDRLREVAYGTLSPVRRRYCHRRMAQAVEEVYAGDTETIAGELASHFEAAGMAADAMRCYEQAARVAQARFADSEAAALVRRAVEICRELPPNRGRDGRELALLAMLGGVLMTAHGYAATELGEVYGRALELSHALDEREFRSHALAGTAVYHVVRGQFERCAELARELLTFTSGNPAAVPAAAPTAHFLQAIAAFHLGRLPEARDGIEQAWAVFRGAASPVTLFAGINMRVFCGSYRSHILWIAGDEQEALRDSAEMLAVARREAHPFGLALALDYAALLAVFLGDAETAGDCALEASRLCERYAFSYYLGWSEIVQGWAQARRGAPREGCDRLQRGIQSLRSTGGQLRIPFYYSLLADAFTAAGQTREALASVASGLAFLNANGERWAEPELHRVHGAALEREGRRRDAAASYRDACNAAERIGAAGLSRRALRALDRLGTSRLSGAAG